jgi:Tol biopolymer transport system component
VTLRGIDSYQIFALQNEYSNAEQITHSGIHGEYGLAANGGKMVYTTENIDGRTIWVSDYNGGNRIAVAEKARWPRISLNGKLVAFPGDTSGKDGIWLVGSDGGGLRQLTSARWDYPQVFSPDSKWIYYSHWEDSSFRTYRVPTTGGAPRRVSEIRQKLWDPSPDGQSLLVEYWDDANQWHWGLVSTSDGKLLQFLDLPRRTCYPAYMPAGDTIAYVDTRNGVSNVWKWPLKNGKPVQLTHFNAEEILSIAFTAEGRLFASRGHTTSEVLLIKSFQARN